jgi:hypothetical protein
LHDADAMRLIRILLLSVLLLPVAGLALLVAPVRVSSEEYSGSCGLSRHCNTRWGVIRRCSEPSDQDTHLKAWAPVSACEGDWHVIQSCTWGFLGVGCGYGRRAGPAAASNNHRNTVYLQQRFFEHEGSYWLDSDVAEVPREPYRIADCAGVKNVLTNAPPSRIGTLALAAAGWAFAK